MTTVMLILIGLGVAAVLAAFVYVAVIGWRLYKAIRAVQREIDTLVAVLTRKQELAMQRAEKIQTNQIVLQQRVETMKTALDRLGLLLREVSAARARLNLV